MYILISYLDGEIWTDYFSSEKEAYEFMIDRLNESIDACGDSFDEAMEDRRADYGDSWAEYWGDTMLVCYKWSIEKVPEYC